MKRWTRWLGGLVAVAVAAFAFGHDALYRWAALRIVQHASGARVSVEGTFDVTHASPLELHARGVVAEYGDGARARVEDLHLRVRLGPLLGGTVHVESLSIAGASADLAIAGLGAGASPGTRFGLPVVERVDVTDVDLRITGADGEAVREVRVDRLSLGVERDGRLRVAGQGTVDGDAGTIAGLLGSPGTLIAADAPFPVDVQVRIPDRALEIDMRGSIERPADGTGLDLRVGFRLADLRPLLAPTHPDVPPDLALEGRALVTGDTSKIALGDLELRVHAPDREVLAVSGSIGDLQALSGLDLAVAIDAHEWLAGSLLGASKVTVSALSGEAHVRGDAERLALSDLSVLVSAASGAALRVGGRLEAALGESGLTGLHDTDAGLELRLPLSAFGAALPAWLDDAGHIEAAARLRGSAETLALEDVRASARGPGAVQTSVTGRVPVAVTDAARIAGAAAPLDALVDVLARGARLDVEMAGPSLAALAPPTGPLGVETGKWSGSARVEGTGRSLLAPRVHATVEGAEGARVEAEAALGDLRPLLAGRPEEFTGVRGKVTLTAPGAAPLGAAVGVALPDLGRIDARFAVADDDGWSLSDVSVEVTGERGVHMTFGGAVAAPLLDAGSLRLSGVHGAVTLTAPSTASLGRAAGVALPDLGRVDARFAVSGEGAWSLSDISVNVSGGEALELTFQGAATALGQAPALTGELVARAPDAAAAAALAGITATGLAGVALDARGTFERGAAATTRYEGTVTLGETTIDVRLALDTTPERARPMLSGSLSSARVRLGDVGLGSADPAAATNTDTPASGHEIGVAWLGALDADVEIRADEVVGSQLTTKALRARIVVDDRRLTLDPFETRYQGGEIGATLTADAGEDPPKYSLRGHGAELPVGAVVDQFSAEPLGFEGRLTLNVDLAGEGRTLDEIVSTLDGGYGYVVEDARLPGRNIDALGFQAVQLFLSTFLGKNHSDVDCAIAQFRLEDGLARSEALYLTTSNLEASGTGTMNLRERTLDVVVRTRARRRLLFANERTVRISGPFAAPELYTDVTTSAAGVAVEAAGIVALPPVGIPLAGLNTLRNLMSGRPKGPCDVDTAREASGGAPARRP